MAVLLLLKGNGVMELESLLDEGAGRGKRSSRDRLDRERGEHNPEQLAWLAAVAAYQKVNRKKFLRHTEYLEIAKRLGYRRESRVESRGSRI